jgi:hypothetical protein
MSVLARSFSPAFVAVAVAGLVTGCVAPAAGVASDDQAASAPSVTNLTDKQCSIILRSAEVDRGDEDAQGFFSIDVVVDVSSDASGGLIASPAIQWTSDGGRTSTLEDGWQDLGRSQVSGFHRLAIRLTKDTIQGGQSETSLQFSKVSLIPFLVDGSERRFDHNRPEVSAPLSQYTLDKKNAWSIKDDPRACH